MLKLLRRFFNLASLLTTVFFVNVSKPFAQRIDLMTSGLYYKSLMIVICDCNDVASTIKLNYYCKDLASVINYDYKRYTTIWSINLMLSFTIVICL